MRRCKQKNFHQSIAWLKLKQKSAGECESDVNLPDKNIQGMIVEKQYA